VASARVARNLLELIGNTPLLELKPVGDVLPIIEAGGIFAYAKEAGMLK